MERTKEEDRIENEALDFAKKHKKSIAKRLTDTKIYQSEDNPVSVFMAGSPGAGKTETSVELIERLSNGSRVLRIDPDDLRAEFSTYTGNNSYLFQKAVSVLVEKIHDEALRKRQSFLLDGTLSNYDKAQQNIARSLKKDRKVQILYVYQDPKLAWEFVQAREQLEGRKILLETFIHQYFAARDTVNKLKENFSRELQIDLLIKNIDNSLGKYKANIDKVDNFMPEKYTPAALKEVLDK